MKLRILYSFLFFIILTSCNHSTHTPESQGDSGNVDDSSGTNNNIPNIPNIPHFSISFPKNTITSANINHKLDVQTKALSSRQALNEESESSNPPLENNANDDETSSQVEESESSNPPLENNTNDDETSSQIDTDQATEIDCTTQALNWRNAPQMPRLVCNVGISSCYKRNNLAYAINLYAQSQYYDCKIRRQIQSANNIQKCKLREGNSSVSNLEDLCDSNATTDVNLLYDLSSPNGAEQQFAAWTQPPEGLQNPHIYGILANVQKSFTDESQNFTRMDLSENPTTKTILTAIAGNNSNNPDAKFFIKAYFKEARATDGSPTNHYIVGRYWDRNYGEVVTVRIHLKIGVGSSLFINKCPAADWPTAKASSCTAESVQASYFDNEGEAQSSSLLLPGIITQGDDLNFIPANNLVDTFLGNQSIDDYFKPEVFNPPNPPSSN